MSKQEFDKQYKALQEELNARIDDDAPMTVIKAPPGSGKTHLLVELLTHCVKRKLRVAVATQTNSQAEEVCDRIHGKIPKDKLIRYVGSNSPFTSLKYIVTSEQKDLPSSSCVVVATSAKWGAITPLQVFDFIFIEEAWQLKTADFLPLCQISGNFILIGDPGQIPPVVTLDVSRWSTSKIAPHLAAPDMLLRAGVADRAFELPATRRLLNDSVDIIRSFYDFKFGAYVEPGQRKVEFRRGLGKKFDRLGASMASGSISGISLQTPDNGPPLGEDRELAALAAQSIDALLEAGVASVDGGKKEILAPGDIGIAASHRAMVQEMTMHLPDKLRKEIRVDTAERWQGLERKLMLVFHPLSGVTRPSEFDLGTGRLCVMASRHKFSLIVLGRDHIPETLVNHDPTATQALGQPDANGRGHSSNRAFIEYLVTSGKWLKVS